MTHLLGLTRSIFLDSSSNIRHCLSYEKRTLTEVNVNLNPGDNTLVAHLISACQLVCKGKIKERQRPFGHDIYCEALTSSCKLK